MVEKGHFKQADETMWVEKKTSLKMYFIWLNNFSVGLGLFF